MHKCYKMLYLGVTAFFTIFLGAVLVLSPYHAYAVPTLLTTNDVVIVTANADTAYAGGACATNPHSNAIDLLLRVPISTGTVIKVTDNGWTGSSLTATEGVITYTAAADMPAGSIIRYSDCILQTGGSGWVRTGSFDPGSGGDTLLVYQGADASPTFLYGFGFRATSWIASGLVTAATSYVPIALQTATPAAYVTGTTARNYQYTIAGNIGIYSAVFLSDIRTITNWSATGTNAAAGTQYGPTPVVFDAARPAFNQAVRQSPAGTLTNANTVTFRITTTEAVQPLSSTAFAVATTGALTYASAVTSQVDASTYDVVVSGLNGEGTVRLAAYVGAQLLDSNGNAAVSTSISSQSYTIDTIAPGALSVGVNIDTPYSLDAPSITWSANDAGSGVDHYTVSVDGAAFQVATSPYAPVLAPAGSHTVVVRVYDVAGNYAEKTVLYPPIENIIAPTVLKNAAITDTTIEVTGPTGMMITAVNITGAGSSGFVCDALPATVPIHCASGQITATGTLTVAATNDIGITTSNTQDYVIDTLPTVVSVASLSTANTSPALTGSINDPTAWITVTVDGHTYPAVNNGDGSWSLAAGTIVPALIDGTYEVSVYAQDPPGNVGIDATMSELEVDTTAPVGTVVPVAPGISGSPALSGTVNDVAATVVAQMNGSNYPAVNNGDGSWSLAAGTIAPTLTEGDYTATIIFTDSLGNESSVQTTVTILRADADSPTVESVTWIGGRPTIRGTYDSVNSTSLLVEVNGLSYLLGTHPELTAIGNIWTLSLSGLSTELQPGRYDVVVYTGTRAGVIIADETADELTILAPSLPDIITHPQALAATGVPVWRYGLISSYFIVVGLVLAKALKRSKQLRNYSNE